MNKKIISTILLCFFIASGMIISEDRAFSDGPRLSDGLSILCEGTSSDGDHYELVASQKESALGFEIQVGITKNNTWLVPLTKDSPFLAEENLFHVDVSPGKSGTALNNVGSLNRIIKNTYFIDSGAFLMECYKANGSLSLYDRYYVIQSCSSLASQTIDLADAKILLRRLEPVFVNGTVKSYGNIYTDNGLVIIYKETSGTISGWTEDQTFDWLVLDTRSLNAVLIGSEIKGVRPSDVLSEGLYFCTDKGFYNINGQKVIDLSAYIIDGGANGSSILFEDSTCSFKAKNSLGTYFLVTIDTKGNVISEKPM